ncbi:MAG: hypothetical protein WBK91_03930 [Alphaproteobacteria bacterium]
MKQFFSDLKKILFGGLVVLAAMGWLNAAQATRGLDRIMTRDSGMAGATETIVASGTVGDHDAPDVIEELINAAPRQYHSTVRVLPHVVYGVPATEAEAAHEARRRTRQCDWLELGCVWDREVGL